MVMVDVGKAARNYWANMTPAERSVEMKRRMEVAREKRMAIFGKPKRKITAAGLRALREGQRRRWAKSRKRSPSSENPFPPSVLSPTSIRSRLEALEAALAALKADIGI